MSKIPGDSAKHKRYPAKSGRTSHVRESDAHAASGFTIGRSSFGKISAVEGIKPTNDALARAREFDRNGLSSAERRGAIIAAYRTKP